MNIAIREAELSDLSRLVELYKLLDFYPEEDQPLDKLQQQFMRHKEYPDYHVFVAELDNVIVGTFALIVIESAAHGGKPFGIVEDVVVSNNWQGKGIGKKMMLFAMHHCQARGCYKLALSSHLQRNEAHKFYESLGFEKHGFSFQIAWAA
ncbi:GNAT family N-acetyltransferase [Thiobacillus sp.]|jgi:GNAT superfamily N-acetyltransferase|uniref:GNAT family N-acetyltransferase n=1 Tax=Thiobacillus sp. TaxID=924 RepID=UPI0025E69F97|nr:GNAT family N-acetyltransferase [Thiobacillus sp.]